MGSTLFHPAWYPQNKPNPVQERTLHLLWSHSSPENGRGEKRCWQFPDQEVVGRGGEPRLGVGEGKSPPKKASTPHPDWVRGPTRRL